MPGFVPKKCICGEFYCRGVRTLLNECPGYDTKQSDGNIQVMVELWEGRVPFHCHRSLIYFDRVLSMGQIELNCVLMLN